MDPELRDYFDTCLDDVLSVMPARVHELLDEVPLYVEDVPSAGMLQRLRMRDPDALCGLYTGVPLTERSVNMSGVLSDVIHLFRRGILLLATRHGRLSDAALREQIRITLLHELGHHHGLSEEELADLGYG